MNVHLCIHLSFKNPLQSSMAYLLNKGNPSITYKGAWVRESVELVSATYMYSAWQEGH